MVGITRARFMEGLVLWLPMSEGAGVLTKDQSIYHNNGVIEGATWVTGRDGLPSLSFDGNNDKVTVADVPSLNPTEEMTIIMSVRPSTTIAGMATDFPNLEEKGDGSGAGRSHIIYLARAAETLVFVINNSSTLTYDVSGWLALEYHRVAVTYNRVVQRIYVDGRFVAERSEASAIPVKVDPIIINRNMEYSGLMDDYLFYNRALDPYELRADSERIRKI